MKKIRNLILISAAFLLLGPSIASAATEFVGSTSTTFDGDEGVHGFTRACQADFGPSARMCDSLEVMRSVTTDASPAHPGWAWVRPVFQSSPTANYFYDASGAWAAHTDELTCIGWNSLGPTHYGLVVNEKGNFSSATCNAYRPCACCIPDPADPISVLTFYSRSWANGLFGVLMLGAAWAALRFRGRSLLEGGERTA